MDAQDKHGPIMMNVPDKAPAPLGAYSHAVWAGPFLYLSGQGARDPVSGKEVGITLDDNGKVLFYDIEAQVEQVMKNIVNVLEFAGLTVHNLVDVTVFLKNIADFERFNQIYCQYLGTSARPARTTVQAADLPGKNFVEIKAVAYSSKEPQP